MYYGGKVFGVEVRSVLLSDQCVGVGGVVYYEYFDVVVGDGVQCFVLWFEDVVVGVEQVVVFYIGFVGYGVYQQGVVGVFEGYYWVVVGDYVGEQWEGVVVQFYDYIVECFECGSDFEQLQDDGLVLVEYVVGGNVEQQVVVDLVGSVGDSYVDGLFYCYGYFF